MTNTTIYCRCGEAITRERPYHPCQYAQEVYRIGMHGPYSYGIRWEDMEEVRRIRGEVVENAR
jgi:hypothetical protein